jgi:hypothetical protein
VDDLTASGQVYTCEASFLVLELIPWLLLLLDTSLHVGFPYDIIALSGVCVRPFGGQVHVYVEATNRPAIGAKHAEATNRPAIGAKHAEATNRVYCPSMRNPIGSRHSFGSHHKASLLD